MDPNATLTVIREAIALLGNPDEDVEAQWNAVDQIVEHFTALDEWLLKGGFLPSDWTNR